MAVLESARIQIGPTVTAIAAKQQTLLLFAPSLNFTYTDIDCLCGYISPYSRAPGVYDYEASKRNVFGNYRFQALYERQLPVAKAALGLGVDNVVKYSVTHWRRGFYPKIFPFQFAVE